MLHLQVIVQYLLDKYREQGPSLIASTPEGRARAMLCTRIHDLYIVPIQVRQPCYCTPAVVFVGLLPLPLSLLLLLLLLLLLPLSVLLLVTVRTGY